jgi:hypothetical protein
MDGRLPRKSKVRAAVSHNGDLYLDLPDEHDPITIPRSER